MGSVARLQSWPNAAVVADLGRPVLLCRDRDLGDRMTAREARQVAADLLAAAAEADFRAGVQVPSAPCFTWEEVSSAPSRLRGHSVVKRWNGWGCQCGTWLAESNNVAKREMRPHLVEVWQSRRTA